MILFTVITKGIEFAVRGFDNWIHRVEKANEAMNEAVGEYESAKSSLEGVNTELDEQNKKLDELLAKDKLTYAEKGQLEELQAITKELLLQQDIEEKRAELASKEAADKTVDAFQEQYGKYDKTEDELKKKISYDNFPVPEDENDVLGMVAAYVRAKESLENSQKDFDDAVKNGEDTTWLAGDVQANVDAVDEYSQALDKNILDLQEKRTALEDEYNKAIEKRDAGIESLTSPEKEIIGTYETIYDLIRMVYEYTDPNAWKSMQIENVFNTKGIEKTKEELIEMVKAGTFDEDTLQSYPKLSEALEQNKVSASELCNELEALAKQEADVQNSTPDNKDSKWNYTETITQLDQMEDKFSTLDSVMTKLYDKDASIGFEDYSSIAEIFKDVEGLNISSYIKQLQDAGQNAEQVKSVIGSLIDEYLSLTGVLDNVNKENQKLIVSFLEENGVINADELITEALTQNMAKLAAQKLVAAHASFDLATATAENIDKLIEETGESENTKQTLALLALEKRLCNDTVVMADGDIKNLQELARQAGFTQEARSRQGSK